MFRTTIPNLEKFVIYGTMPVESGIQYTKNSQFTILDQNEKELPTQWEPVAYRANGDLSVVKLYATNEKGNLVSHSRQQFHVIKKESEDFQFKLSDEVKKLTTTENAIKLRGIDYLGNTYEMDLTYIPKNAKNRSFSLHERGSANIVVEVCGNLNPIDNETYPYLMGVQALLTTKNLSENIVELTLDIHNGESTQPISDVYFQRLELVVPSSWRVKSEWPEPQMNEGQLQGDSFVIQLINPLAGGKMHVLPQFFKRTFALFLYQNSPNVDDIINKFGWAVSNKWLEQSNYYPQMGLIPNISINNSDIIDDLSMQYTQLREGLPWHEPEGGDLGYGQMGYFNPAGTPYGGQTSGDEVEQWDGILTILAGIPEGLRLHRVKSRRYTDRAIDAIYENGVPIKLENYLNADGSTPWSMFDNAFEKMSWPHQDQKQDSPWNFDNVDNSNVNYITSHNLKPQYEELLRQYFAIDAQHQIRRLKNLKVLIWLDNDHTAKRHLAMQAELNRMTYFEGRNGRYSFILNYSILNKNKGGTFGRGNAWTLDTCISHYACSDQDERERWHKWLYTVYEILRNSQMGNGMWQRETNGKTVTDPPFNGKYSVSIYNENIFTVHALRGMQKSVFEGVDDRKSNVCKLLIWKTVVGSWNLAWEWKQDNSGPDGTGPWFKVAVGPLDPSTQPFLSHSQSPPEQYTPDFDSWHIANLLAYGFDLQQEHKFNFNVNRIIQQHAGNTPLEFFLSKGIQQLDSRTYLIALLQKYGFSI